MLEKATLEDDKQSSQRQREDGLAAAAVSVALSGRRKAEGRLQSSMTGWLLSRYWRCRSIVCWEM